MGLCLFFLGELGPSQTVAWAEAYLHTIKLHLSPPSRLATMDIGRKLEWGLCPFRGGGAGSPSNNVVRLRPTSVPCGILIQPFGHTSHEPKIGGCAPLFLGGGALLPHTQVAWAEVYLSTTWHLKPSSHLATTDMGRKLGAVCLWGRGSWVSI